MYEFIVTDDITVVQGCGLGGTSLINANVALNAEPAVFQDPSWPKEIREDMDMLMNTDRQHFVDMIKPTPYPDNYPTLDKMERMKDGLSEFDIEDLHKMFYKTPLYVTFQDTPSNHVGVRQMHGVWELLWGLQCRREKHVKHELPARCESTWSGVVYRGKR